MFTINTFVRSIKSELKWLQLLYKVCLLSFLYYINETSSRIPPVFDCLRVCAASINQIKDISNVLIAKQLGVNFSTGSFAGCSCRDGEIEKRVEMV